MKAVAKTICWWKELTHLALGSQAIRGIDPHVLSDHLALLRELKVFLKLAASVSAIRLSRGAPRKRTLAVLEMMVDSA